MITSSAQRTKWCIQRAQSSEQTSDSSIEKAEDNGIIFFALSVVKVAPQARPKTTWYAWNCFENLNHSCNGQDRAGDNALTLKRASRSNAKTGSGARM